MYGTRLCSSLDLLIREETRVQILSASLEECGSCSQNQVFFLNLKLACQSKEGLTLNQSQAVWFGFHSGNYDKQTTAGLRVWRTPFWCWRLWFWFPLELTKFLLAGYEWDSTVLLHWRTGLQLNHSTAEGGHIFKMSKNMLRNIKLVQE